MGRRLGWVPLGIKGREGGCQVKNLETGVKNLETGVKNLETGIAYLLPALPASVINIFLSAPECPQCLSGFSQTCLPRAGNIKAGRLSNLQTPKSTPSTCNTLSQTLPSPHLLHTSGGSRTGSASADGGRWPECCGCL